MIWFKVFNGDLNLSLLWFNLSQGIWLESPELKALVWFQSYRSAKGPARAAGSFLVRHLSQKRRPHKSLQETGVTMDNNNSSSSDAASPSAAAAAASEADKRIEGRRFIASSSWAAGFFNMEVFRWWFHVVVEIFKIFVVGMLLERLLNAMKYHLNFQNCHHSGLRADAKLGSWDWL